MAGKKKTRRMPRGFTLVELTVVIAIIGILATLVIVRFVGKTDEARVATARSQLSQLEGAVIEFQAQCGRLPNALDELVNRPGDTPKWRDGGYLKGKNVPKDPWGHEYKFRADGGNFEIVCLGSDGSEGGTGFAADLSSAGADEPAP